MSESIYRKLLVWQKAIDLVVDVYQVCKKLPKEEIYGLASQMRRAAISVPANIAEGQGRRTLKDKQNFLSIAMGSLKELETHLIIAGRLDFLKQNDTSSLFGLVERIAQMLDGLINSLKRKDS
jgi:four helix bundle protein